MKKIPSFILIIARNFFIWFVSLLIVGYLGLTIFPTSKLPPESTPKLSFANRQLEYLQKWSNWDGGRYLEIASVGYGKSNESIYAFFPFYALAIKIVSFLLFKNFLLSALLVSWMSFFVSLVVLYKLILLDFHKSVAIKTVNYLLVFPFSFFFLATYTESLFLLLTLLTFYWFRKSSFLKSGLVGMFATATRIVGLALIPSLFLELIQTKRKNNFLKATLTLIMVSLGILSFMFYLFKTKGDVFYFLHVSQTFFKRMGLTYPFKVLFSYLKNFDLGGFFQFRDNTIISLEFIFSCIFFILIILGWKKLPKSYTLYSFMLWSMPLMTGRTGSMLRYVITLFPCFIVLGLLGRNKYFDQFYILLSSLFLSLFLVSFINGYWVA